MGPVQISPSPSFTRAVVSQAVSPSKSSARSSSSPSPGVPPYPSMVAVTVTPSPGRIMLFARSVERVSCGAAAQIEVIHIAASTSISCELKKVHKMFFFI